MNVWVFIQESEGSSPLVEVYQNEAGAQNTLNTWRMVNGIYTDDDLEDINSRGHYAHVEECTVKGGAV